MFVGHYGISFVGKRSAPSLPLWLLFIAVQLLDVVWAPLVLLGIEKVSIVPGVTASNPLLLSYMPFTHSLLAALIWSAGAYVACRLVMGPNGSTVALVISAAVFSHWPLDFLVHRPDLPLYDNTAKVGLGLWNFPVPALCLEAAVLFGGIVWYLRGRRTRRAGFFVFGIAMLAIQTYVFFGPPPVSDRAAAWTALAAYAAFAAIIRWVEGSGPRPAPATVKAM
jgi:hypothetical protein